MPSWSRLGSWRPTGRNARKTWHTSRYLPRTACTPPATFTPFTQSPAKSHVFPHVISQFGRRAMSTHMSLHNTISDRFSARFTYPLFPPQPLDHGTASASPPFPLMQGFKREIIIKKEKEMVHLNGGKIPQSLLDENNGGSNGTTAASSKPQPKATSGAGGAVFLPPPPPIL